MSTYSPVCGICDLRHISKPSAVWCPECDEGLCEDCKEHHTLSKSSRNHSVIAVSDYQKLPSNISKITLICSEHNEQYQMYCKKHESPCCRRCISENHNSCQEICPLEDVIHNVKISSAFQEIEQTLREVAENHERIIQNRKENLKSLKDRKEKIQKEILQIRWKINSHLDRIQDDLIKKLDEVEEKESQKIRNLLTYLEKKETEIKTLQCNMVNIKEYASDLQSFLAMKHMDIIAIESLKEIQELVSSDNLKEACLFLNVDTGLENFVSNVNKFGEMFADYKPTVVAIVQRKNLQAQLMTPNVHIQSIDNIKLNSKHILKTCSANRGCVVLPDGRMIITSAGANTISIVNKYGLPDSYISFDHGKLFDVTYNPKDNTIAVSRRSIIHGNIDIVDITKRKITKTIRLDYPIDGIVYRDDFVIFCARDNGIQMMNIRDRTVTNVVINRINQNAYITTHLDYIYYTDSKMVKCCDIRGQPLWIFIENDIISSPLGITVDNEGVVYVVDNSLQTVVVISPDGQKCRTLLSKKDGIKSPWALVYDRLTDQLLIANGSNTAYLYTVTK